MYDFYAGARRLCGRDSLLHPAMGTESHGNTSLFSRESGRYAKLLYHGVWRNEAKIDTIGLCVKPICFRGGDRAVIIPEVSSRLHSLLCEYDSHSRSSYRGLE